MKYARQGDIIMLGIYPDIVKARQSRDPAHRRIAEIDMRADYFLSVKYFLLQHLKFSSFQCDNRGYRLSVRRPRYN